jgi:uncharacterized protein YgiB involved in biofilm formation
MKRTQTIRLVLMGLSPFVVAACSNSQVGGNEEHLYPSAQACIDAGKFPAEDCRAAFETAVAEHQQSAPRYDTEQACIDQHGAEACTAQTSSTGQSSFLPFMAGMLMGRAFNTGFSRPAYHGRQQPVVGGGGRYWPGGSNPAQPAGAPGARALPPPPPPSGRVVTQARSGFGNAYAGRSLGG